MMVTFKFYQPRMSLCLWRHAAPTYGPRVHEGREVPAGYIPRIYANSEAKFPEVADAIEYIQHKLACTARLLQV